MTRQLRSSGRVAVAAAGVALGACNDATPPAVTVNAAILKNLGAMQVGDVRRVTFAQLDTEGLVFPATDSGAQYAIIVANVAANTDAIPQYLVSSNVTSLGGQAASSVIVAPHAIHPRHDLAPASIPPDAATRMEARIRTYERSYLHPWLAGDTGTAPSAILSPRRILYRTVPTVGSTISLHTLDGSSLVSTSGNLCKTYTTTTATIEAVSTHAVVAVDTRSPANSFTSADYQTIANEFDTLIYPTDVSYFGAPTDIDQNGRVVILYTPAVNQLTEPGTAATEGFVGGFFFAGDLFAPSRCAESNQGELFYLLAPDPRGRFGNTFSTTLVRQMTRGTIAHEFQHMINAGNRVQNKARDLEATWLDEALAHFAEDAVGRAAEQVTPTQLIGESEWFAFPDSTQTAFFDQNFARAKYYVTAPDTVGPIVSHARAAYDLAARGAEWALLRYAADWYADGPVPAFTQRLAQGPDTGTVNLIKRTGVPLDSLLGNWLVTLFTDHQPIPNLAAKFNYTSYAMHDLIVDADAGTFASYLPIDTLGAASIAYTVGVPASSAAYFLVDQAPSATQTVKVTTITGVRATDKNGRIYIVRLR